MTTSYSRTLSSVCEVCTNKLQTVAELLLLSCCIKPVWTDAVKAIPPNLVRDQFSSSLKNISFLAQTLVSNVHMISTKWNDICDTIQELSLVMVQFMELTSHAAYLISVNFSNCSEAENGLVDKYLVCYSGLEIKLSCTRLKRTRIDELSPQLIIDLCSNISKHISVITDICRVAGQDVNDESIADQFKLSVKSVTCAAGCLIASIKSYKSSPNFMHHNRVIVFCEPVLASSQALVCFATEKDFIGLEGVLTMQAKEIQKSILGACMNIVSSCIQLYKTIRGLTFDMMTSHHRERLRSCTESIEHGAGRLLKILQGYDINSLFRDYLQKCADSQKWQENKTKCGSDLTTLSLDPDFKNDPNMSPSDQHSNHIVNDLTSNHGEVEIDHHSDEHSTSFSGSDNSCHSQASR